MPKVISTLLVFVLALLFTSYEIVASEDKQNIKAYTTHLELTKDEKELLDNLGELKIIVDDDYAPISFYSKETESFGGISVNVLKILSKSIGFDYHIIRDESLSWSDRLDLIKNNKVHILCGASINDKRKEFGYFTDEYYFSTNFAMIGYINNHITLKSIKNIKNYNVGIVKDITINNYILSYLEDEQVTYFETMDEALVALRNRQIDLVAENETTFIEAYFNEKRFDFEVVHSISDITKNYGYFLPKTKEGLALSKILSRGMKEINIDSVISNHYENKSIFSFYKSYVEELKLKEHNRNVFLIFLIGAVFVLLVFFFFIKKKNNELTKSRRLLAEIEKIGKVGGWEIDIDTGKQHWTEEIYNIHEVATDYVPNVEASINFYTPESLPIIKKLVQQALEQGKPFDTELEIVTAKGNPRSVHAIGKVDLTTRKVYGFFQDITSRKQAHAKHLELEAELRQKHKMEAVGYMAGGMAHNFNNNLSIILGNVELSQMKTPKNSEIIPLLENAKIAVRRSRDLVLKIITYSRKGIQNTTFIHLADVINETVTLLHSTLPTTVNLQQEINPESLNSVIHADPSQIQEVLINLCNNAVHAMNEQGDLKILLDTAELTAEDIPAQYEAAPGPYAKLSIQDTGCGIPTEMLDKIFDPFYSTKEEHEGAGMGLATVQGIVAQHGGIIIVNSIPNQATVFNLYFPITEEAATEPKTINTDLPKGTEKILFIDDDEMLAKLGKKLLSEMGYQVSLMTESTEALKMFTANPDYFDMVITDQTMPQLSGKELIQQLKKIRPDLRTILCTGFSSQIDEDQARQQGIDAFCMKPLDLPELLQTVRRILDGERE